MEPSRIRMSERPSPTLSGRGHQDTGAGSQVGRDVHPLATALRLTCSIPKASATMVRQLTAIMFTDMVGYTALMQEDEQRARVNRDRHREILSKTIASRGGRILQFYGDGTLSVFRSAIEAVHCAVEVQAQLQAEPTPIPVRIGVHQGDVVHDDDGVFGDGVNVASRIEGLGVPGSVLISEKVFDEVKNQSDIETRGLGLFNLKNVKRPMEVHAVVREGLAVPSESAVGPRRAGTGKSIAVLPFVNMSSDPENEFFSDGMTEEIINTLVRINGLKVTARTSSFAFKDHSQDIREIAGRLGVTHVLEGSVRRANDHVRVTSQLICAKDGYHLFSGVYDRKLEDIFGVQDEIAAAIVEQLAAHLGPVKTSRGNGAHGHAHSQDSAAYTEYLRGAFELARWSPDGVRGAIPHYERSIEMDADCALPYSGLATAYVFLGATGHLPAAEAFSNAERCALKGLALEEHAGEAHTAMGAVQFFYKWDWDGAYRSFQKALSLTPGSAQSHQIYGMYLRALGELDDSLEELRTAVALDPLSLPVRHSYAETLMGAEQWAEAEAELRRILAQDPSFRAAVETLGWVKLHCGDARAALDLFEGLPELAGSRFAAASSRGAAFAALGDEDGARRMLALLDERSLQDPDVILAMDYALVHQSLGEIERALDYLEEAVEQRVGAVVFLAHNPFWGADLRGHPRFQVLLERLGHPSAVSSVETATARG